MSYSRVSNLVSVVIPNYNHGKYIKDCLRSILRQSYPHIEIIIVDNGSTDNSLKVIHAIRRIIRSRRGTVIPIKVARLPRNAGFAAGVHIGMFLTKGEFIAIQDADDLSHPNRIAKQVDLLRANPETGLVGTNYARFLDGAFNHQTVANWILYGDEIKSCYASGGHCVCHGSILFRGDIFEKVGGPTRALDGAEDYEFIAKCINHGVVVQNIPEILYYYRDHPNQRSKKYYR
jgi:glycosyltransferase involved in cell wall biosynthesis